MNFVCLTNFHANTIFPFVRLGKFLIGGIVMTTTEAVTYLSLGEVTVGPFGESSIAVRAISAFVILSNGIMLRAKMPVNIDGTHTTGVVGVSVGNDLTYIHVTNESLGNIGTGLYKVSDRYRLPTLESTKG